MGAIFGVGVTDFFFVENFGIARSNDLPYQQKYHSKGSSVLLNSFIDWGGKGLGFRLGINIIKSINMNSLEVKRVEQEKERLSVDLSGVGAYIDTKWEF